MDDATQRLRLRNAVKQSRQLQVILAHAALLPAFLGSWYAWLNEAAIEVNDVWNFANATSYKAARPFAGLKVAHSL